MNFSRVLFLIVLTAGVCVGPRYLASLGPDGQELTQWLELTKQAKALGARADAAGDFSAASSEEAELLSAIRAVTAQSSESPVLKALMASRKPLPRQTFFAADEMRSRGLDVRALERQWRPTAQFLSWVFPGVFLGLALLGLLISNFGLARFFASRGYGLSKVWLWLLAAAASAISAAAGTNAWLSIPNELLASPIVCMAASAILLKIIDMNYPVWNSLLSGLLAPLGSGLLSLALQAIRAR